MLKESRAAHGTELLDSVCPQQLKTLPLGAQLGAGRSWLCSLRVLGLDPQILRKFLIITASLLLIGQCAPPRHCEMPPNSYVIEDDGDGVYSTRGSARDKDRLDICTVSQGFD